jgi:hypothetical protein
VKSLRAQADYHEAVDKALPDEKQRNNWRSNGYDHAFGGGVGERAIAISLTSDPVKAKGEEK